MTAFNDLVGRSLIEWLLEPENPSVRYYTLKDILDRPKTDWDLRTAKADISKSRLVKAILSKQKSEGYWEDSASPYKPKYRSTYWQVMILGQLGLDKSCVSARKACEFILGLQLNEGGFSSYTEERALQEYEWMRTKTHLKENLQPEPEAWTQSLVIEHQYTCLTGNVCAALIRMGYRQDPRIKKALSWLVKVQNSDGGWLCPYWKAHVKDTHGCFYGSICPLEAFSEVPQNERSTEMAKAVEKGAHFLLMHRLCKADHHDYKIINRQWLKFSFPWFYGYNILRGLAVLTKLGYVNDERMEDALKVLLQKRCSDGTWLLDSAPIGRMQANIEPLGKPSKWITLNALKVLKRLSQTNNQKLRRVLLKHRSNCKK